MNKVNQILRNQPDLRNDSTPRQQTEQRGSTDLHTPRETIGPYPPRRSTRPRVCDVSPDPYMFHQTVGWYIIERLLHMKNLLLKFEKSY